MIMTKVPTINPKSRVLRVEDVAAEVKRQLGEQMISIIYRDRIRPMRTRSYRLDAPMKKTAIEIMRTLLGVELKIGKRRVMCPDLAMARYLSVFARLGLAEVATPYDITQVSRLADDLESSWYRMLTLVELLAVEQSARFRNRVLAVLIADERRDVIEAGAGPAIPQFNQNTKQRKAKL
ncbi:MAG: hypothetical protein J2P21_08090 [Chloracidobacterium sp.]|nr:hypothetical protein [Chloracidobacterium sp.]